MDKAENMIKEVMQNVFPLLNEKQRRLLAGSLALGYGYGGQKLVCGYSHLTPQTLCKAVSEIKDRVHIGEDPVKGIRKPGAGRKNTFMKYPGLLDFIDKILQGNTYGNPMSIITYTSLSLRAIAERISQEKDIHISPNTVSKALTELGYSKQKNQKMEQAGGQHPDRDTQFRHINETGERYIASGLPFISVDCKKKGNIGNFKNNGQEYRHTGDARRVLDYDFPIRELGKVAPYGVYTVNNNTGLINLGTGHDTAEFVVESIRGWWYRIGRNTFPGATKIYITADGGGSNGSRSRVWKLELAKFAEETGLSIEVSHFPPGASKWNKIEHRLFGYISKSWEGKPLVDIVTAVKLIGSTTTKKGLKVICDVDGKCYPVGIKVKDEELELIDIEYLGCHQGWNYVVKGFKN